MPCTEVCDIPLKPGVDIEEPSTDAYKAAQYMLKTISEQPGCQHVWHGRQHENPSRWELLIVWDKLESHAAFTKSDVLPAFMERLNVIKDGQPKIMHVNFERGDLAKAVSAPAVEMVTMYHEGGVDDKQFDKTFDEFANTLEKGADGNEGYGTAGGWVVEELEHSNVNGKAKAYMAAIGWQSVDAHMKFRDTQAFKDSIPVLRSAVKGLVVHHTKFSKV